MAGPGRDRGMVYQRYSLFPFLTAEENVAFGPMLDQTLLPFRFFQYFKFRKLHRRMLEDARERLVELKLEHAAPGVLQLRAALTEAKGANVPLKAITTIVPQLKLISTLVGTSADIVVTVGEATLEAEILDSMTKQRLAAAVDQQAGKKWYSQLKTWSDVKSACEYWAKSA